MVTSFYIVSLFVLLMFLTLTLVEKIRTAFNKRKKHHFFTHSGPTTALSRK